MYWFCMVYTLSPAIVLSQKYTYIIINFFDLFKNIIETRINNCIFLHINKSRKQRNKQNWIFDIEEWKHKKNLRKESVHNNSQILFIQTHYISQRTHYSRKTKIFLTTYPKVRNFFLWRIIQNTFKTSLPSQSNSFAL